MNGVYLKLKFDEDEILEKIKEVEDATESLKKKVNELSSWLNAKASSQVKDDAES